MADTTTVRGNPFPEGTDDFDVAGDIEALADALDLVPDALTGTLAARPASPSKPTLYVVVGDPTSTNNGIAHYWNGSTWTTVRSGGRRIPHGFASNGPVVTGAIPGWSHSQEAGETRTLVKVRHRLGAGTATVQVRKNGNVQTTLSLTTTPSGSTASPFPISLAEDDYIDINVTAASSNADDLSVTLFERMV